MLDVTDEKESWTAAFALAEKRIGANEPAWLTSLRREAIARFSKTGLPTTEIEEWRYTNVAAIARTAYRSAPAEGPSGAAPVGPAAPGTLHRLVFVNGRYAPELSTPADGSRGVTVASLRKTLAADPGSIEKFLGRHEAGAERPFVALNTAFFEDGAYVRIADGAVIEAPIEVVHWSTGASEPVAVHPRTLVVAGRGSQATVVETYLSGAGDLFVNPVTEIIAGENAVLDHVSLQDENIGTHHVGAHLVRQARSSVAALHAFTFGAALSRSDVVSVLDGEGSECRLNGLYIASGTQHVDHHTWMDHAKPHCASREVYKGILGGTAKAIFSGKIIVRPDAQKTDSKQTNKNLLLSDEASVNTKPQLEIYADDVKCTHGATIGQLDDDSIFYLRARGIGREQARQILIHAFAAEMITRVPGEGVRARLETALNARLRAAIASETGA